MRRLRALGCALGNGQLLANARDDGTDGHRLPLRNAVDGVDVMDALGALEVALIG
ncbi:hypothetical protein ACIPRI_12520 [Variovorax sp. LARHSF232]